MQFSTLFAFAAAASMVAALPKAPKTTKTTKTTVNNTSSNSSCSVGKPQCCNSLLEGDNASKLAALVGVETLIGAVGVQCNHIPVIAGDVDNSCKTTPVCCDNTAQDGLIHLSCTPVSVN